MQNLKTNPRCAVFFCLLAVCHLLPACHNRTPPATPPEKHQAMLIRPGAALYVDRVDNRVMLQQDKASQDRFCCFRIGWADSTVSADRTKDVDKGRYFQYNVQKDWKALAGGDTLLPVFFQERPGLSDRLKEGVLVFETPTGRQPDTLIYRDSFGAWGTQLLVIRK
jgi:hypothetical protein